MFVVVVLSIHILSNLLTINVNIFNGTNSMIKSLNSEEDSESIYEEDYEYDPDYVDPYFLIKISFIN